MKHAIRTSVSVEKSRAEIEATLRRYGADQFISGWDSSGAGERAVINFRCAGRQVKFILPLPSRTDRQFAVTPARHHRRSQHEIEKAWEQACRQRWRALALAIKAKLECVECGISTFESEFLAHICLPDGQTVSQWMQPQLALAYERGAMPKLLQFQDTEKTA